MRDTPPLKPLQPSGWPIPRGFSHGMMGSGRMIFVGGQVGMDSEGRFAPGFLAQTQQALRNLVAVLAEAGASPQNIARITWYVLDMREYHASLPALGPAWHAVMGRHYPAMTLLQVSALVEPEARLEIEATALMAD